MGRILAACFILFYYAVGCEAESSKRIALVIGNSAYVNVAQLPNPVNDANAIAAALGRLNFDVQLYENLDADAMRGAIKEFVKNARGAEIGLVYFAGHGMEMNKQNYLIPVDAKLESDRDVEFETVPLDLIVNALEGNVRLKVVLLDACRNNPFLADMERSISSRSIGRGLAKTEPVDGTLVSYSAREGQTANDGDGRHSPYTRALLDTIEKPGVELNLMFRIVRDDVLKKTNKEQEPYFYASLPGRSVYLKDPASTASSSAADDWNQNQ